MAKYSVVVFDLGNVLIPFDYQIVINQFNSIKSGLGNKFYKLYQDNYNIHRDFEKGILSKEEFISIMLEWLEYLVSEEQFCRIYSSVFTINQDVADLLPLIKGKGYTLVLLSNTNPIHKKYGYEQNEFLKYFDKLILSHEVKSLKPEKEIYKAVETFTGKPPAEHFFIDDIKEYIDGAKNCGWNGVQFTNYQNLLEELKKEQIL